MIYLDVYIGICDDNDGIMSSQSKANHNRVINAAFSWRVMCVSNNLAQISWESILPRYHGASMCRYMDGFVIVHTNGLPCWLAMVWRRFL